MAIRRPTFYPEPWASDEAMDALTPDEMAAGYPAGTSEKPSRQSINGVLQYATNGVLYFLIRGVPEWMQAAAYEAQAIVFFADGYYVALEANVGEQPDTNPGTWERMPWRRSELDAIYLSRTEADSRYLTTAQADLRFYTRAVADATFLRITDAAFQFITQAALDANYITRDQAAALFLTQAQGDARYARIGEVVTNSQLNTTLANYITTTEANATFMTQQDADARFMTTEDAAATFLSQADAHANFLALQDAGMTMWREFVTYARGALVLDAESGVIFQSQQDENTGNSVSDTEWWVPWQAEAPPQDLNGMFLHCISFMESGTFEVSADQIPLLANHPEGIYLKWILKGPGGWGSGSPSGSFGTAGHGGGEGFMREVVIQKVTAAWFPLTISIAMGQVSPYGLGWAEVASNSPLDAPQNPSYPNAGTYVLGGWHGDPYNPGEGGRNSGEVQEFRIPAQNLLYNHETRGASGRWGTPGLRGGDGGGAHGASGAIVFDGGSGSGEVPGVNHPGLYGCGGGGRVDDWYLVNTRGGDGYVLIYW